MRGCRGIFGSFLDSILYYIRGCWGIFGSLLDSILYYTGGVGVYLGVCWIVLDSIL